MNNNEIIYTEHVTGEFEDGLQICIMCGKVIIDYTGNWQSESGHVSCGWKEGIPIYISGKNPVVTQTTRPLENYGDDDPYIRKIIKCV